MTDLTISATTALLVALVSLTLVALGTQSLRLRRLRRELEGALAERDARMENLRTEVRALLDCSVGVGDLVHRHGRELRALAQGRGRPAETATDQDSYRQAAALSRAGASAEEIVRRCGLSTGEAELLARLSALRQQRERTTAH